MWCLAHWHPVIVEGTSGVLWLSLCLASFGRFLSWLTGSTAGYTGYLPGYVGRQNKTTQRLSGNLAVCYLGLREQPLCQWVTVSVFCGQRTGHPTEQTHLHSSLSHNVVPVRLVLHYLHSHQLSPLVWVSLVLYTDTCTCRAQSVHSACPCSATAKCPYWSDFQFSLWWMWMSYGHMTIFILWIFSLFVLIYKYGGNSGKRNSDKHFSYWLFWIQ